MPILSVRVVKHPRTQRYCDTCLKRISGEAIRLYGMADYGDKPYQVFLHRDCITGRDTLAKLRAAEQRNEAESPALELLRRVRNNRQVVNVLHPDVLKEMDAVLESAG